MFGVFRVKNHDLTQKDHIFPNFRGGGALDPPLSCTLFFQNKRQGRHVDNKELRVKPVHIAWVLRIARTSFLNVFNRR